MIDNYLRYMLLFVRYTLCLAIVLSYSNSIHAAEVFTPGIYVNDANGDQYIVSGSNGSNGRSFWTIVSIHNSNNYFSGIWETGPAVGNSILAGTSNIVNYPSGYGPGRSYGVIGKNNRSGWYSGNALAAYGSGSTISIADLSSNGSTRDQFTLSLSTAKTLDSASEQYSSGIYRDFTGYGYLVSGAPSQSGRTAWTIVSLPDNPKVFNASWETGPAIGNSMLAGSSNISSYAPGYLPGRSYGVVGQTDFSGWYNGDFFAAVRAGDTISVSKLSYRGSTSDQFVLIKENSSSVSYGTGSENFSPGYYRSQDGKRYLVSGSGIANGRKFWTIASVSMPTIFNACWETGPAVGNSLLAGDSDISNYSAGYAAGRSYGVIGDNNISGWYNGYFLAAIQTGDTISLSYLGSRGSTSNQFVLTKEPGSADPLGPNTESYLAGTDYSDARGRTYTVSGSGGMWSVSGTNGTNFNAQWQTGPATSNTLLAGSSNISNYPQGYLAGRSYGVVGNNNFSGWYSGSYLAAARAGNTISLSRLSYDGSTSDQFTVTKGGTGGTGNAGKIALGASAYYVNKFDGKAVIRVTRTDGGVGMVAAMYSTTDGTAHSSTDYIPVSNTMLAWNDGDTESKFININIPNTASANTSFTITLSTPVGGAAIGSQATATVVIISDIKYFIDHYFDYTPPTPSLSTTATNPTKTSPIPISINFSKAVTGFAMNDIIATNGTLSGFTGSGKNYSVNVTPIADGLVTIRVPEGIAQDGSGNKNTASTVLSLTYDNTAPTVTLSSTASSPTGVSPIPVAITFSENVSNFDISDITVTNGSTSAFTGSGKNYSVNITPTANGTVTVRVPAGVAQDGAGNKNMVSADFSLIYDNTGPAVALTTTAPNPTKTSPIPVRIAFSEAVIGFVMGDITVTNGTLSGFTGAGANYSVKVTPIANAPVTVRVPAGVAQNGSGNYNRDSTALSITFDNKGPKAVLSSATPNQTNSPIPVSITFTEAAIGFVMKDITVTNGKLSEFTGSGANYSVKVTPIANGPVTVKVLAGIAQDEAGNKNVPSNILSRIYDRTSPKVTLSSTAANPTKTSPVPVTITFSESVTGFDMGLITVKNGTLSGFRGSGKSYSVRVTPTKKGVVSLKVNANAARDAAGNGNTASALLARTFTGIPKIKASAGPNQNIHGPYEVKLSGVNSRSGKEQVSYQWKQLDGPIVELSDISAAESTFIAPSPGAGGDSLKFQLTTTTADGTQSRDTCIVNITSGNIPPVANAGMPQTVSSRDIVRLDGSDSSDPDDGIASFGWKQLAGLRVALSEVNSMKPTFVAPDAGHSGGSLLFELTVTDNGGLRSKSVCIVNVQGENDPPDASAGADQKVSAGMFVALDGSASSDKDDGIASYEWKQLLGKPVHLSYPTNTNPIFVAPQPDSESEILIFQLLVTDKGGLKSQSEVKITVEKER